MEDLGYKGQGWKGLKVAVWAPGCPPARAVKSLLFPLSLFSAQGCPGILVASLAALASRGSWPSPGSHDAASGMFSLWF